MSFIPTYPDLAGKVAFITGGSGDIGAETARWLASNGVRVAVSGRDAAKLDAVLASLTTISADSLSVVADCTNAQSLEAARKAVAGKFGPVDILIAFAGGGTARPSPLDQASEADWRSGLDHNLTATFLTLKTFLPDMKARKSGAIVTMASTAGRAPSPASASYSAAKAGIIMLTQHLAQEVGPDGIRVNCVSPSSVVTDRTNRVMSAETQQQVAAMHPLPRLGQPADVAGAALFLASDSAGWITGATLDVAGGRLMH